MAALLPILRRAERAEVPVSDAELIDRFGRARDEAAFTELVRRHGPVVYRICQRLVGSASADDAFQATFLVLATKLRAARASNALGGWLAGVAGRVARQMRRGTGRRARYETAAAGTRATEWEDPSVDLADQFRALDEELTRLPDTLRDPVVLCLLQGYTQEQAAAELGRDARTLRRRLERAKSVLRSRLERRGVIPAVAGALVLGAGEVTAVVSHGLDRRTVALVFDFLTGGPAPAAALPVALAKGLAMTTFARKLVLGAVTGALGLVGLGAVLADGGPPAPAPAAPVLSALTTESTTGIPPDVTPVGTSDKPEFDWARDEDVVKNLKSLAEATRDPKAGPSVFVQATCVRVPTGFCERIGLKSEHAQGTVYDVHVLTPRETRMFTSLLRVEPNREVLTRPQMLIADKKTGSSQISQNLDMVTEVRATTEGQNKIYTAKTMPVEVGFKMQVTPTITSNGLVHLEIKTLHTNLVDGSVKVGGARAPILNEHAVGSHVLVPDSGTVVFRTVVRGAPPQKATTTETGFPFPLTEIRENWPSHEILWILTTHVVRVPEKGKESQPAPTPAAPVAPVTQPLPPVELPPRQ
ncbi:ECF RNA polymerase sigma factor SigE [Gemmata sp. SH-PL17]|uniref:sigma-70 family RNA polymerase sigma factor n=1 Tax=Gemmata sp. SH-PL17 TaxID=1630693 RepID=UPI00078BCBC5|nr:sigma-70 family RNA polymerase sigma factor [Gemmata sp. SH-PL17]AMV24806.1 ECF RNA polymerase sigma factor SigE [Gemmata sp. SH-PL17]